VNAYPYFGPAKVAKVVQKDQAIFLELELLQLSKHDGTPELARATWLSGYHGEDFGDWWLPAEEDLVYAAFPLGQMSRGYAFSILPAKGGFEIPTGHKDDSSDADDDKKVGEKRRVHRGKKDEALDVLRRGDVRLRIDAKLEDTVTGDKTSKVEGDHEETVEGDRTTTIEGDLEHTTEGDATIAVEGDRETTVDGDETSTVKGDLEATVQGDAEVTVNGETTGTFRGKLEITGNDSVKVTCGSVTLTIESSKVTIDAPTIELGSGTLAALCKQELWTQYILHEHEDLGSGPPKAEFIPTAADAITSNVTAS
jgi:hypothetical protein